MINGVLFGNKHSYKDFGLILQEKPSIKPPAVKTMYVDIPLDNGSLDLTEIMTDDVKYDDRELSFTFGIYNRETEWNYIYTKLQNYFHGQKMKIILDDDPNYYYEGRCEVDDWKTSRVFSTIVIKATVKPYKYELYSSLENWLWDTFNFETGIIREYGNLEVNGSLTLSIQGTRLQVIPIFEVEGESLTVEFNGNSYLLPLGKSRIMNISLKEGINVLKFQGNGKVSIDYRGGEL